MAATSLVPYMDGADNLSDLPAYTETGLWFVHDGPGFFQRERIHYPDVTGTCWFEKYYNYEIVLRDEWYNLTETAKHRMLIYGPWKIIYMPLHEGVEWELYNIEADPREEHDLAGQNPPELEVMKKRLFDFLQTRPGWNIMGDYFVSNGEDR